MTSNLSRLKMIDHYLGLPICVLLSLWYGLMRLFSRPRRDVGKRNKILVIKFFGQGSIGYSTVIVRDLKKEYPHSKITLLTFKDNLFFAEFHGAYDAVIAIDNSSMIKFILDTMRTIARHLLRPYDVCIDLEYFSKYTTMHTACTRAPIRIGFYLRCLWRRYIYTDHSYFNTAKHIRSIYGMAAVLAGAAASEETTIPIVIGDDRRALVADKLRRLGWDGASPLVGINVNASDLALGRRWPLANFAELAAAVAAAGSFVCLTGAPSEREYVQCCLEIVSPDSRSGIRNIAGDLSITEFLAFLKLTALFITNDSGPMIFAILTETPSVSIWGPGDPAMYGGSRPIHSWVYSAFPCSPCMYVPGTNAGYFCNYGFPCISAINASQLIGEVMSRLNEIHLG